MIFWFWLAAYVDQKEWVHYAEIDKSYFKFFFISFWQWRLTNSDLCLNKLNMQLQFELTFFICFLFFFFCFLFCQIDLGLPYLCEVLKELPEQKQTKSWYMLRARTFSTCSAYLALDTTALPQTQRSCLTQLGQLACWFLGQGSAAHR